MKKHTGHIPVSAQGKKYNVSCLLANGDSVERETFVYLHGLGSTKGGFSEAYQIGELNDYNHLLFDFPGSGLTKAPKHDLPGISDLVDLTFSILSYFNLRHVTLVGHSMGGLVGLLLAKKYPDRVARLINVEGNLAPEDCDVFSRRAAVLSEDEFLDQNILRSLQDDFMQLPYIGARAFAQGFLDSVDPRSFHKYCQSIVAWSDSGSLLIILESLNIPRLFIHGDANNHLSYLEALGQANITIKSVSNSYHWPHISNPGEFYSIVRDFIEN